MDKTIFATYDRYADVMYASLGQPCPAYSREGEDGILWRFTDDGDVPCGVTILGFRQSWAGREAALAGRIAKFLDANTISVIEAMEHAQNHVMTDVECEAQRQEQPEAPTREKPAKLPREEWTIHQEAPGSVIVGAWEHPPGYRWYEKFCLSDLPNEFVSLEDLKRLGVNPQTMTALPQVRPPDGD